MYKTSIYQYGHMYYCMQIDFSLLSNYIYSEATRSNAQANQSKWLFRTRYIHR
jgi:hypothetical protein